jgi:hypothetical protein
MKKIRFKNFNKESQDYLDEKESNTLFLDIKLNLKIYIYIVINSIILLYLATENILNKKEIKKLVEYSEILKKNINLNKDDILAKGEYTKFIKGNFTNKAIDKDMIGLKYPEIMFDHIKENIVNNKFKSSIIQFLTELEIKLIFLEKEINATKINAFYTARTLLLKKRKIDYDDSNITELHNIVSWLVIHRSTQLKGIVSDKYLACRYAQMKLGINLCPQRIKVYDSVDEINFKKLIKMGNVILKISNGNNDNTYIYNDTKYYPIELKKKVEKSFYRNFPLIDKVFSHCYSRKRIVLEKMFIPISDLYEFKFIVVNNDIKVIYIRMEVKGKIFLVYYDANYKLLPESNSKNFNISIFKKETLEKLKYYALKLSEDFPNFIRIDLYVFHDKIYLSELTFDHREGKPNFLRDNIIIREAAKNWRRIDCDL